MVIVLVRERNTQYEQVYEAQSPYRGTNPGTGTRDIS